MKRNRLFKKADDSLVPQGQPPNRAVRIPGTGGERDPSEFASPDALVILQKLRSCVEGIKQQIALFEDLQPRVYRLVKEHAAALQRSNDAIVQDRGQDLMDNIKNYADDLQRSFEDAISDAEKFVNEIESGLESENFREQRIKQRMWEAAERRRQNG